MDVEKKHITRTGKSYRYYYENVSTIPHIVKFDVIDSISKKRIGTLDQQFVGDYGEKGNVFVLRGSQWRILVIDEGKFQVHVEPLSGAPINVPYWVGEMIPVDYETAMIVGKLRKKIRSGNSKKIDISFYDADPKIIANMSRNMKSLDVIPDSSNLVFETIPTESIVVSPQYPWLKNQ